jgi:hypothetical protein
MRAGFLRVIYSHVELEEGDDLPGWVQHFPLGRSGPINIHVNLTKSSSLFKDNLRWQHRDRIRALAVSSGPMSFQIFFS